MYDNVLYMGARVTHTHTFNRLFKQMYILKHILSGLLKHVKWKYIAKIILFTVVVVVVVIFIVVLNINIYIARRRKESNIKMPKNNNKCRNIFGKKNFLFDWQSIKC